MKELRGNKMDSYTGIKNGLIAESPTPVEFYDDPDDGYIGAYYHDGRLIRINNARLESDPHTIVVLAHEVQHAKCHAADCECVQDDNEQHLAELHAMLAELKLARAIGDDGIIQAAVDGVDRWLSIDTRRLAFYVPTYRPYIKAAEELAQTSLYKKLCRR